MNIQYCKIILLMMTFAGSLHSLWGAKEEYPSTYLILAPATVRPGLMFTLSVQIRQLDNTVNVMATIRDKEMDDTESPLTVNGTFSPYQTGTLDLEIPDTLPIPVSQYDLEVKGTSVGGDLIFNETKSLQFDVTHFAIFVQTDKAIYKPGQTVNYRIFAVYPGMQLYKGSFDITVLDPDGNIIQLHTGLRNETYGVVTQSMVMSSEPVLGDWQIKVLAERQEKIQTVTVDEYVLPKFEVGVQLPPYMSEDDSYLYIQISAKYTYGKPVKASADVFIQINYYDESIKESIKLDGTADIRVSKSDLEDLYRSLNRYNEDLIDWTTIIATAVVTEDLTGLQQNSSATVTYYTKPIKVEALPITSSVFKPGLTYTAFLTVTHQDGSMLTNEERRRGLLVAYRANSDKSQGDWIQQAYSVPETGVVEARYNVPRDITSLSLKAFYYRPSQQEFDSYQPWSYSRYLMKMDSPSSSFMQIALETEKVLVGKPVNMIVTTTEIATDLTYVVAAQGSIKLVRTVASPSETTLISFTVDASMAPKARIIISFIRADGEVVVDSVELNVDGSFQNEVSVSFNKTTSEPGEDISFTVKSSPNSFVGILAVDQSVLLLKSGNDVTQEQVIESLSSIDTHFTPRFEDGIYYRRKRRTIWYPGFSQGSTARSIIDNAGFLAFTDANIYGWRDNYFFYEDGPLFAAEAAPADDAVFNKADVAGGAGRQGQSQITVRKEFPETWLWSDYLSDDNGQLVVRTTVPDTITSWIGSAFAVSMSDGLGISEMPAKTTVFKPFFVSLNLPYSIIRGETLVLQATVFNYFDDKVQATVTLGKSSHYEIITVDKNGLEKTSSGGMVDKVIVPAGSGVSVFFPLNVKKLGMIDIEVTAVTQKAGDAVRRQLLVEPEGVSHDVTDSRLFNEGTDTTFQEVFDIRLPPADRLIPGSVRVMLSLTGDIMGPTMGNLDSLLKMPYGCGEQNMMNFAPDVFVYEYLTKTNQSNDAIKEKALRFMLSGYQRELTYKHDDGSFSAFGKSDPSGSSWLTAFVLKSFTRAEPFITIDPKVIEDAVLFIINQHSRGSGQFREPGRIVDRIIKGGVNPGATLTAYITIALAEAQEYPQFTEVTHDLIRSTISSAKTYLEGQLDIIRDDPYALCMVTYALALTESRQLLSFKEALGNLAISEGGQTHWEAVPEEKEDAINYWYQPYHGPASGDIEMTAYALLTYVKMGDNAEAAKIAKWMTHQRGSFGGYGSTQDTVIGLQALTEFAMIFRERDPAVDVSVTLSSDPSYLHEATVNTDNAIVLQQVELPTQSGSVTVDVSGRGTCLMTLTVFYNTKELHNKEHFVFTISILDIDSNNLEITACGRYKGDEAATSMCLMDIGIPSGFVADRDHLVKLADSHALVQKFEDVQQSVYLYFQEIPKDEMTCVTVHAVRANVVAKVQPKYARLYDYYKPAEQVIVEYSSENLQGSTVCDVCPECAGCTGGAKQPLVSLVLLVATLIIAVFVGKV